MECHKVVMEEVNFVCIGRTKSDAKTRVCVAQSLESYGPNGSVYLLSGVTALGIWVASAAEGWVKPTTRLVWITREEEEYRKTRWKGKEFHFQVILFLENLKCIFRKHETTSTKSFRLELGLDVFSSKF